MDEAPKSEAPKSEDTKQRKPMIRLTGLWASKTSGGDKMLAGNLGGARVLILPNKHQRPGSKDPDYNLCIVEPDPKPGSQGGGGDAI